MRQRTTLRAAVVIASTALLIAGAGIANATTPDAGSTGVLSLTGSEPLPPYTISNPPLAPITVNGSLSRVFQGTYRNAAYIVEAPANWNRELVLWTHGYRGNGTVLSVDPPQFGLREKLLTDGYAWAASSYTQNGVDIASGVTSTKDLADYTPTLLGRSATRTFITGPSLGGYVIGRSLDQYPGFYAGAMPLCGGLGGQTMMDYFLDYNVVAQALAGLNSYPIPADYLSAVTPEITSRLGLTGLAPGGPDTTNALGNQLRAVAVNISGGPRPGADNAFASWYDFLFQIYYGTSYDASPDLPLAAVPGRIGQNLLTVYQPNNPKNLNLTVERVRPKDLAGRVSPLLTEVPAIFGFPTKPVLSLHGLGDMYVPFSQEQDYRTRVDRNGRGNLVVQRAIRTVGHCEFSNAEVATAWDDLVRWVRTGVKPAGDAVGNAVTVAKPTFGCAFSDRAAFTAGTGSRRLFPACP